MSDLLNLIYNGKLFEININIEKLTSENLTHKIECVITIDYIYFLHIDGYYDETDNCNITWNFNQIKVVQDYYWNAFVEPLDLNIKNKIVASLIMNKWNRKYFLENKICNIFFYFN